MVEIISEASTAPGDPRTLGVMVESVSFHYEGGEVRTISPGWLGEYVRLSGFHQPEGALLTQIGGLVCEGSGTVTIPWDTSGREIRLAVLGGFQQGAPGPGTVRLSVGDAHVGDLTFTGQLDWSDITISKDDHPDIDSAYVDLTLTAGETFCLYRMEIWLGEERLPGYSSRGTSRLLTNEVSNRSRLGL